MQKKQINSLKTKGYSEKENLEKKMFDETFERLKKDIDAKSDTEFAKALGLKQSAVSSAKSRGKLPTAWAIEVAKMTGTSLDWLIFGKVEKQKKVEPKKSTAKISELLTKTAEILESNTGYKTALLGSIEALYDSMKSEIEEKADLKTRADKAERENHDLKMQCLACENKDEIQQTA